MDINTTRLSLSIPFASLNLRALLFDDAGRKEVGRKDGRVKGSFLEY